MDKRIENDQIEKLKQEQLINSILNRKKLEDEATLEAAQELYKFTQQSFEDVKKRVFDEKIKQEKLENEKQLEAKRKLLDEVDKEIEEENKRILAEKEERKKETEKHMQELRRQWEKRELEKFRKKKKEEERKKQNLLKQLEEIKKREEIKKIREISVKNHRALGNQPIYRNVDIEKERKVQVNKVNTEKEDNKEEKGIFNFAKRKLASLKRQRKVKGGVNTYEKNMDYYSRYYDANQGKSTFDVTIGGTTTSRRDEKARSFVDSVRAAIDNKAAIKKAKDAEKAERDRFKIEPRVH